MRTFGVIMAGGGGTRFLAVIKTGGAKAAFKFKWKRFNDQ